MSVCVPEPDHARRSRTAQSARRPFLEVMADEIMRLAIAAALTLIGTVPLSCRRRRRRRAFRKNRSMSLHSKAVGSCPSLDWHIVSGTRRDALPG